MNFAPLTAFNGATGFLTKPMANILLTGALTMIGGWVFNLNDQIGILTRRTPC